MKFLRIYYVLSYLIIFIIPVNVFAQKDTLRTKIEHIIEVAKGNVGVAIISLGNNDTLTINGDSKFPMQSVYKFPLALAVLDKVDKGILSLDQKIFVKKEELLPNTWSPLREKYPEGNVNITLDELLTYTVSVSDNNGCDILFRLLGGPKIVNGYIHNLGITNIAVAATEEEMHKDGKVQFSNWCTPYAMGQLLSLFYHNKILSTKNGKYLMQIMVKTSTGTKRIKGLLPTGTIVAHKTGSSGSNEAGVIGALNDVGIVTLPNGNHFVIVVFISNSTAEEAVCENVIAKVTKAVWDWSLGH
ncbi:MAG: class A beta-lactamase, subclass A2 [Ignavibacteriaceae bacterium]|jgi:beta-lactamase class A|nr:class A beta-lactamase, subclass A2 [Ignavibacteriaceae bacterium]